MARVCERADAVRGHPVAVLLSLPARPIRLVGTVLLALLTASLSPASAAATETRVAGAASDWRWPIAPPRRVVQPFIAPESEYGAGHRGIDIAAAAGTMVVAPADGVVHFSGTVVDRSVLSIEHAGDLVSSFEPVSSELTPGTVVRRGEPVGVVDSGGHCESRCLHFGVRLHGQYVSPLNYLGGIRPPVLLPTRQLP